MEHATQWARTGGPGGHGDDCTVGKERGTGSRWMREMLHSGTPGVVYAGLAYLWIKMANALSTVYCLLSLSLLYKFQKYHHMKFRNLGDCYMSCSHIVSPYLVMLSCRYLTAVVSCCKLL